MTVGELRKELSLLDSNIEVRIMVYGRRADWKVLDAYVERVDPYWVESKNELFLLGGDENA